MVHRRQPKPGKTRLDAGEHVTLTLNFELEDKDLRRFHRLMREAHEVARDLSRTEIIDSSRALVRQLRSARAPEFSAERLAVIETLIAIVDDVDWDPGNDAQRRVLDALVHFCEPVRILREVLYDPGALDDALAIELVRHELRAEIDAYVAFCDDRDAKRGTAERVGGRNPRVRCGVLRLFRSWMRKGGPR